MDAMKLYDGIYQWQGWGGVFRLGSGRCRLWVVDFSRDRPKGLHLIRPVIVVASDVAKENPADMTVRSCNSHIATSVAREFAIDPARMQFVEYSPRQTYGVDGDQVIAERFDAVDFTWHEANAMKPVYRPLAQPLLDLVRELVLEQGAFSGSGSGSESVSTKKPDRKTDPDPDGLRKN